MELARSPEGEPHAKVSWEGELHAKAFWEGELHAMVSWEGEHAKAFWVLPVFLFLYPYLERFVFT